MALNYGNVLSKKEAEAKQPTLTQMFKEPVPRTVELNRLPIVSPGASVASGRLREAQRQLGRSSERSAGGGDHGTTPEERAEIRADFRRRNEESSANFFSQYGLREEANGGEG